MHFNLDVLPKLSSTAEVVILLLFPNSPYTDQDRLTRLHLYASKSEVVRIVYLHESTSLPCSLREGSKTLEHRSLENCSLHDRILVTLEGQTYTILRRLSSSQLFMKEVNPHHFVLELHDEILEPSGKTLRD